MSLSKDEGPTPTQLIQKKKDGQQTVRPFVLALPIFPARLQASIFGRSELNFRVRNGNGWTLALISTNLLSFEKESKQRKLQAFSLLTVFFNSKYFIKFSSHCQFFFCFAKKELVTRTGIEPMFAA